MNLQAKEIFGAEIQYFRLDPQYWDKILTEFESCGLRTVNTYVPWEYHMVAPPDSDHPIGVLDFTGETNPRLNLHLFLELVESHGLNLNFRCGPFCCAEMTYGGHPPFVLREIPEIDALNSKGEPTEGYGEGNHQPSYLHPVYLDLCRKWIDEVDKIILPHLKENEGCITMINLDNEISYVCWDTFLDTDYNPVVVGKGGYYHQFLKETYGSAKNLPYRVKYASIEDVEPPRAIPTGDDWDFAWCADWLKCRTWIMSRYIAELRKMHEANGITPDKVIFMTNFCGHLPDGVPARMPDFESATMGITGFDFYRSTFMAYWEYHAVSRVLKLMNHTLRFPYSSEFMSGTWRKDPGRRPRVFDDCMRYMSRIALAHGCKAIQWYMFADRDRWNDAPVSTHGHRRTCIEVLKETETLLFEKITNWEKLQVRNDLAVIYDLPSHLHTAIGSPQPCNDGKAYRGEPLLDGSEAGLATLEYMGIFRLAEQNGAQAAAIDILFDDTALYQYPLVILPGSPVIARDTEEKLMRYVKAGGTLAVTGRLPAQYETGEKCTLFGGITTGTQNLGNGRVIVIDRYLGLPFDEDDDLADIETFGRLMEETNIIPRVRISCEPCEWVDSIEHDTDYITQPRLLGSAILQETEDERILFVFNHYPEAHTFTLRFNFPCEQLVCLTEETDVTVKDGVCTVDIDRKNCQIYRIQ